MAIMKRFIIFVGDLQLDNSYSVFMALMDFIPVFCFIIGTYFLSKVFFFKHQPKFGWMAILGGVLIFLGGGLQATWKLFKALDIGDYQWMSQGQFVFMAFGYVLLLVPAISLLRDTIKVKPTSLSAIAAWKIPFLAVMTLASLATYGILTTIAYRRGIGLSTIGFITAILGVILLGGMANQVQTINMQWIEQSVNSLANFGFAVGCYLLFKDFMMKKEYESA